jgi:dihydrofolate reductase
LNISIIVAASLNHVIGKDNQLLWHLPNDMKFFKQTTWAMPVVMGRKTFESIGSKPLPGRVNIVLSKQNDLKINAVTVNNISDVLFVAQEHDYNEIFVIGGAEIYNQFLEKANKIYLTKVHTTIDGDAYFDFDKADWRLSFSENHLKDEKHLYDYTFETWIRK